MKYRIDMDSFEIETDKPFEELSRDEIKDILMNAIFEDGVDFEYNEIDD